MSATRRPRTERWVVARHVDRLLGLVVQPAYEPELPRDQYEAALAHAVTGLMVVARPHAETSVRDGWSMTADSATGPEDWMKLFAVVYDTLWKSGVLRPAPLEEEEV